MIISQLLLALKILCLSSYLSNEKSTPLHEKFKSLGTKCPKNENLVLFLLIFELALWTNLASKNTQVPAGHSISLIYLFYFLERSIQSPFFHSPLPGEWVYSFPLLWVFGITLKHPFSTLVSSK